MSYLIDLYRGDVPVQRNIISFGTYVSLFPQLIAGPIVRMRTVVGELADRRENFDDFSSGVKRFVTGLGKKVLIANTVGAVWSQISAMDIRELPVLPHGLAYSPLRSRFISIFPAIRIWRWVLERCWALV